MDVATLERPARADRTSARPGAVRTCSGGDRAVGVRAARRGSRWSVAGVVHVDAVVSVARAQHAMPGMGADDDPVAEDERRISVDVTLRADEDDTLEYAAQRFRLTPDGGTAEVPHELVLPGEELPPGTRLSGTLVFDVPVDAHAATLSYGRQSTPAELPAEAAGAAPAAGAPAPADVHGARHG